MAHASPLREGTASPTTTLPYAGDVFGTPSTPIPTATKDAFFLSAPSKQRLSSFGLDIPPPTRAHRALQKQHQSDQKTAHTLADLFFDKEDPRHRRLATLLTFHQEEGFRWVASLLIQAIAHTPDDNACAVKDTFDRFSGCLALSRKMPEKARKKYVSILIEALCDRSVPHNKAYCNVLSEMMNNELLIRSETQAPCDVSLRLFHAVVNVFPQIIADAEHGPFYKGRLIGRMWGQIKVSFDIELYRGFNTHILEYAKSLDTKTSLSDDSLNVMQVAAEVSTEWKQAHTHETLNLLTESFDDLKQRMLQSEKGDVPEEFTPLIKKIAQLDSARSTVLLKDLFFNASCILNPEEYHRLILNISKECLAEKPIKRPLLDVFQTWNDRMTEEEKRNDEGTDKTATNKLSRVAECSALIQILPELNSHTSHIASDIREKTVQLATDMYTHTLQSFYAILAQPWSHFRMTEEGILAHINTVVATGDKALIQQYWDYMSKRKIVEWLEKTGYTKAVALLEAKVKSWTLPE